MRAGADDEEDDIQMCIDTGKYLSGGVIFSIPLFITVYIFMHLQISLTFYVDMRETFIMN